MSEQLYQFISAAFLAGTLTVMFWALYKLALEIIGEIFGVDYFADEDKEE